MDLSIVIPARDVGHTLGEQLDALLAQHWPGEWEVVVVDNRSEDDTPAVARHYAAHDRRVRVVEATASDGLCYSRAEGIDAARADAIAICDGDDVVGPRWVAAMGDALREHRCVTGPLEVARLNPPWLTTSRGRPDVTAAARWHGAFPLVSGGNLGIRRELWRAIGPFDERYLGSEDHEFSLRLFLAGVDVHFERDALVHYRYRAEPAALWRQGNGYGYARPLLRRKVREAGLPVPGRFAGWRSWAWLVVHTLELGTTSGRARWLWVAGNRVGQARGSIHFRTVFI